MSYGLVPRPPPFLPFIRVHNNTRKGKIKNGGGLGPRLSELHVGVSLGRVPIHKEYVFSVCTGGCPGTVTQKSAYWVMPPALKAVPLSLLENNEKVCASLEILLWIHQLV